MKAKKLFSLVFALLLAFFSHREFWPRKVPKAIPVPEASAVVRVVGVTDGDTIKIVYQGNEEKVRLAGVDAPESSQPFGQTSKKALSDLVFGRDVLFEPHGRDQYGRLIGYIIVQNTNVNQQLVRNGFAWWYRAYAAKDETLASAEAEAKAKKRGLWRDARPVPPWEWRKQH